MALLQLPRDPADTKRKENLEAAFKKSAEAPYRMADAMSELLPAFTQLLLHCNKNVITDAVIAAVRSRFLYPCGQIECGNQCEVRKR